MAIPLFDTHEQLEPFRAELAGRMAAVIESGRFVLGPEVAAFEREFADYLGVEQVVGVANGTDAIRIALQALGVGRLAVGEGDGKLSMLDADEVIVPSFTFVATAEAVIQVGARPVFCDIDPETFCVTAETVERVLTPNTRAIVPVHIFGLPAPMDKLRELARERDVALLEDAAQAAGARFGGARAGSLGDAATFSFYPSKNLFCLGDGGAIATNDEQLAARARLLRMHGSKEKTTFEEAGWNSRLDELQAVALRVMLPGLDERNARRQAFADAYAGAGLGEQVSLPHVPEGSEHVYHMYVVRSDRREQMLKSLEAAGIEARANYERPLHRQPAMEPYISDVELPVTEAAARVNLALPMGPTHDGGTARAVVEALSQAVESR
jgi:UDP-N-acetyl-3-dehydro-alpha-D-glucosamine 3-aminotranferase